MQIKNSINFKISASNNRNLKVQNTNSWVSPDFEYHLEVVVGLRSYLDN